MALRDYTSQDALHHAPFRASGPHFAPPVSPWAQNSASAAGGGATSDSRGPCLRTSSRGRGRVAVWWVRVPPPDSSQAPEPGAGLIRQLTSPRRGAVAHLELHHGGLSAGLSSCSAGNGPLSVIVRNGSWGPGRTKMWDLGSPEGLCGGNAELWGGSLGSDQAWGLRSEEREPIP